jgi:hypothetical protein
VKSAGKLIFCRPDALVFNASECVSKTTQWSLAVIPQGLKPAVFSSLSGTTEVVP